MTKIFFFTPIFNYQDADIIKNHQQIRERSFHEIVYVTIKGASPEHAKSIAYKKFLESDCEYFFNVDADIFFFQDLINPIDLLVSNKKDIVGGIYVYKKQPCMPTHRTIELQQDYEENGIFPDNYKFNIPKETHEVKWLSGGCMLIHRNVIEKLTEKYQVPNLPMIYKKEYLSEDFSFCQRAIEEGFKIYAEPRIKLGHQGLYLYTLSDYDT